MYQNPKPRTAAQLSAILDARNVSHGVKRLSDVLPYLVPLPNKTMRGFSSRAEAVKADDEFQGGCNHD